MKKSKALDEAYYLWRESSNMSRTEKRSAVKRLASLGFSEKHIGSVLGISMTKVRNYANTDDQILGGVRAWFEPFHPGTLDAMKLMAVSWEDDEHISSTLTALIVRGGTTLNVLSYYTGIPLAKLREAING